MTTYNTHQEANALTEGDLYLNTLALKQAEIDTAPNQVIGLKLRETSAHETLEEMVDEVVVVEWKNGDDCIYKGEQCFFVGNLKVVVAPLRGDCMIQHKGGAPLVALLSEVSKPETETQKLERERNDAVKSMFEHWNVTPKIFERETDPIANTIKELLYSLHDAGYRKGE